MDALRWRGGYNEAATVTRRTDDMSGVAPYALDATNADRLWEESLRLIAKGGS